MKYLSLIFIPAIFIVLFSCKKDQLEIPEPSPITYPNYGQLKVGNYWVYERFEIDTNGNETPLGIIDTCYIEKDTLIDGKTYFKYVRAPYLGLSTVSFIRDSMHYLVEHTGRIIFSSKIIGKVFREFSDPSEIFDIHDWMTDENKIISTPYGSFKTLTFQMIYYYEDSAQEFGHPIYKNYRYAENIGIVSETLLWIHIDPNYIERRLVDYHIEQ